MRPGSILLAALPFLAAAAMGQECQLSDTALGCWTRYNPVSGSALTQAQADAMTQQSEAQTQQSVAAANTGIASLKKWEKFRLQDSCAS